MRPGETWALHHGSAAAKKYIAQGDAYAATEMLQPAIDAYRRALINAVAAY